MHPTDLVPLFAGPLNELGLRYMVVGSVASVAYGEPRVTHDVDVVLFASRSDVDGLVAAFPSDDFYCPPREILLQEVLRTHRGHFNLVHHQTGFRADVYLSGRVDELHAWGIREAVTVEIEGTPIPIAPP